MRKIIALLVLNLLILTPVITGTAYAQQGVTINLVPVDTTISTHELTRENIFTYYADFFRTVTPSTYKYIELNFKDVHKGSDLYDALQVLVYQDVIDNKKSRVFKDKKLNAFLFYTLSKDVLGINTLSSSNEKLLKLRFADTNDQYLIKQIFKQQLILKTRKKVPSKLDIKKSIFQDVLNTLSSEHYDKENSSEIKLIESAIEGLARGTGDKHTTYFPPVKTNSFKDTLSGEFEGIGAYVDMETPGVFKIISPITGSPAFKAGLKGGDRITKVDGKEITKDISTGEVISWIKGPKGTVVILTVERKGKVFDLEVTRDKIVINDIETEVINRNTFYINITKFGPNVSEEFKKALEELNKSRYITKVIIDVRNNGGGYLDQVTDMLSYMVPEGEPTAIIKYLKGKKTYRSAGYELVDFSKYKIVILQNSGTASASEILAGSIKDYYPESTSIGEQSYGKGSVQQIKQYKDGSLLKYTVARWYTGGSETSISGVGLTPDIVLELDIEEYKKTEQDNQLNKALKLR